MWHLLSLDHQFKIKKKTRPYLNDGKKWRKPQYTLSQYSLSSLIRFCACEKFSDVFCMSKNLSVCLQLATHTQPHHNALHLLRLKKGGPKEVSTTLEFYVEFLYSIIKVTCCFRWTLWVNVHNLGQIIYLSAFFIFSCLLSSASCSSASQ